ncbi:MAG: RNA-binding domain-containing protein [Nanoarchaeota archaeon]
MKLAHQIKINVFSYEKNNEDDKLVLNKFLELFPFDLKDEKIELKKSNAAGFEDKNIAIFEVALEKEKHTGKFLENLVKNLDEWQKKLVLSQLESRLDDNLDFFLRLDKDEYMKNNKLKLTDSGNCFHIMISVAAFPRKREVGLKILKSMFINK